MPVHRIEIGAQAQVLARAQYDAGDPADVIARSLGVAVTTLRRRINEWDWPARRPYKRIAPPPLTLVAAPHEVDAPAPSGIPRAVLAARMEAAVERQFSSIDRILAALGPPELDKAERGTRMLSSLAATLRQLSQIPSGGGKSRGGADDEPEIRDLDEFRRDLSRRLDRLVAEAKAVCSGSADEPRS